MRNRIVSYIALVLFVLEILLCLVSWLLGALIPGSGIRSVFGSEGIRWLFGHHVDVIGTPLLVWILLLSVSYGCFRDSGLAGLLLRLRHMQYRERIALYSIAFLLLSYVSTMLVLTVIPHAVLLSVTGNLFPSPFSAAFIPIVSFGVCLVSVVFGIISGRYHSVFAVYHSLFIGVEMAAPLFILYILSVQLYYTFCFVLM